MEKQALLILAILIFLIIRGFFGLIMPARVDRFQKQILMSAHLISREKAAVPMSTLNEHIARLVSVMLIAGCAFLLANCTYQAGTFSTNDLPTWHSRSGGNDHTSQSLDRGVRRQIETFMRRKNQPGLVVAVIADDSSAIYGFGRAHLDSNAPPDSETLFEIGSISKVFTGILLADYLEKRTLPIDTPIIDLLPAESIRILKPLPSITLKHLVTHTAAVPVMPDTTYTPAAAYRMITAKNMYRHYTDDIMIKSLYGASTGIIPGKEHRYSNYGYGLLGLILSHKEGMSYHQIVEEVIARPLKLTATGVLLNENQRSRLATGYRFMIRAGSFYLAQVAENWEMPNSMAGCGALRSSGHDMLLFLAANMGRSTTTISSVLKKSHQVLFAGESRRLCFFRKQTSIGMGWMHSALSESGAEILWHDGATGGYTSFIGFSRDGRFGVVVLSNSSNRVDSLGLDILNALRGPK